MISLLRRTLIGLQLRAVTNFTQFARIVVVSDMGMTRVYACMDTINNCCQKVKPIIIVTRDSFVA